MTEKAVLFSFLVFLMAAAGGIFPLLMPNAKEDRLKLFVAFGAGLLLGMAFLHMLPEAAERVPHSFGIWFLLGFLILLVLERFVMVHACDEVHCDYHAIGVAAFAGLTIHGIIEGFALASSLVVPELAMLVLIGILSHKAPAGFALTSILKLSGKTNKQILGFVLGVSLSVPLGCALASLILQEGRLHESAGILLSISAGTFLYIGACDLLPELHKSDSEKFKRLVAFLLGLVICLGSLIGHQH